MFSVMPPETFSGDSSPYRPAVSSPLSSSPIRASSPPLSPCDSNAARATRRDVQSSPIPGSTATSSKFFKYAARPARPNPAVQRRGDAQQSRRKLFLKNVRQRADDQKWERRGGEQELLKLEWWSLNRDLQKAKDADAEGLVTEAEIEEAAYLREEAARRSLGGQNPDERMVDAMEHEEDAELDALVSSYLNGETPASSDRTENPTDSPRRSLSDDEDYDAIFMDFLSREQRQAAQQPSSQMDTS